MMRNVDDQYAKMDGVPGSSTSEGLNGLTKSEQRRVFAGPALLPLWARIYRAPRWWFEVILCVVLDQVYEHLRNLVPTHKQEAINRAYNVMSFGGGSLTRIEHWCNNFVVHHEWLAQIVNYDYSILHLPITGGVLIWVFWKHRQVYRSARNVLLYVTVLGLAGFWIFPMAPPRLLPGSGFVDTVVYFHTWGSWYNPKVADASNQYAAMPSLHCAWSLWVGLTVFFVARKKIVRAIGLFYSAWTVFVVVSTANHFILDAVAGWTCIAIAVAAVWLLYGHGPWSPAPTAEQATLSDRPVLTPVQRLFAPRSAVAASAVAPGKVTEAAEDDQPSPADAPPRE